MTYQDPILDSKYLAFMAKVGITLLVVFLLVVTLCLAKMILFS